MNTYKVVLADDEPLLARSIQQMIRRTNPAFEVISIAYDGLSACRQIEELHPDVVFTDINMPMMDGLELSKYIRQNFPSISTVIISGYSEFEHAQQALKAGVVDYLLKPLRPDVLEEIMSRLENRLRASYKEKQMQILDMLMAGMPIEKDEELVRLFPDESYLIQVVCLGSYFHFPLPPSSPYDTFHFQTELQQSAEKYIQYHPFWITNGFKPNEKIVIMACQTAEIAPLTDVIMQMHSDLKSRLNPLTSIVLSFTGSINDLYTAVIEASRTLKNCIIYGESGFFPAAVPHFADRQIPDFLPLSENDKKYISVLLKQKQHENLNTFLFEIFDGYQKSCLPQVLLEEQVRELLQYLLQCLDLQSLFSECYEELLGLIAQNISYSGLKDSFWVLVREVLETRMAADSQAAPQTVMMQRVKSYIDAHYTDPINIQTISSVFCIVPPYLSKLYRDFFGVTIHGYIQDLRIAKVKELLCVIPSIPLKDIAELSGFNDPFYLSKVFKQQTGVNPQDYRPKKQAELLP